MKEIVLIGKCFSKYPGGPGGIIRGLASQFEKSKVSFTSVFLDENCGKIFFIIKVIKEVLLQSNKAVNVHTDGFLIPFLIYLCSCINKRNTYYLTIHGIYAIECKYADKKKHFYLGLERILYKNFPNVICVSNLLKNSLSEIYSRRHNIFVIPNPTDATEYHADEMIDGLSKPMKIILLGGIKRLKGILESLDTIDYLVNVKKVAVKCDIYGATDSNKLLEQVKKMIIEKGLCGCVEYHGMLYDKKKLYAIVSSSDFQLCLSYYDTFNSAIAESLVLGCPCICSAKCGAAYLVKDGMNGLVVDMESEYKEKIWNYVNSFLENPSKRKMVKKMSEETKKKVSWESAGKYYVNLIA